MGNIKEHDIICSDVKQECKMSCEECFKEWKDEYFINCQYPKKLMWYNEINSNGTVNKQLCNITDESLKEISNYINNPEEQTTSQELLEKISINESNKEEPKKSNKTDKIRTPKSKSKEPKSKKVKEPKTTKPKEPKERKINPDSAPGLVKYFYDTFGGVSYSYPRECAQVKRALNLGVTPDGIRTTMNFMNRKGYKTLQYFGNNLIHEAHEEFKLLAESNKEGTAANLVRMYYEGLNSNINITTLNKDTMKVQELLNSGFSFEQVKFTIQFMIDTKCPTINFISNKINEAEIKYKSIENFKSNPCNVDRGNEYIIIDDLEKLDRPLWDYLEDPKYKKYDLISMARKIYFNGSFSKDFSSIEWAFLNGLEVDEEMYKLALDRYKTETKQCVIELQIKEAYKNSNEEEIKELETLFENYKEYLIKITKLYGKKDIEIA